MLHRCKGIIVSTVLLTFFWRNQAQPYSEKLYILTAIAKAALFH